MQFIDVAQDLDQIYTEMCHERVNVSLNIFSRRKEANEGHQLLMRTISEGPLLGQAGFSVANLTPRCFMLFAKE